MYKCEGIAAEWHNVR